MELDRSETSYRSLEEIVTYLKDCIEEHASTYFIADFDHYAHTSTLAQGFVDEDILAARNLIFCFGISLPDPHVLAVRPRSIGVAETKKGYLITFMEAPMPVANSAMEEWANALRNRPGRSQTKSQREFLLRHVRKLKLSSKTLKPKGLK